MKYCHLSISQVFEWDIVALAEMIDNFFFALDGGVGGRVSVLILLDYSKAFDMINHDILIGILRLSMSYRFNKIISMWKNPTGDGIK